jgi:hypothetical protein
MKPSGNSPPADHDRAPSAPPPNRTTLSRQPAFELGATARTMPAMTQPRARPTIPKFTNIASPRARLIHRRRHHRKPGPRPPGNGLVKITRQLHQRRLPQRRLNRLILSPQPVALPDREPHLIPANTDRASQHLRQIPRRAIASLLPQPDQGTTYQRSVSRTFYI